MAVSQISWGVLLWAHLGVRVYVLGRLWVSSCWVLMGRADPVDDPLPVLRLTGTPPTWAPPSLWPPVWQRVSQGTGTALVGMPY